MRRLFRSSLRLQVFIATAVTVLSVSGMALAAVQDQDPAVEQFKDKADAALHGDAAATAPAVEMSSKATYGGKIISRETAVDMDLSCIEEASGALNCFKNEYAVNAEIAKRESRRHKRRASTSFHSYAYLSVAESVGCVGWDLHLGSRQAWYNLTGGYNQAVSGYNMGNHSGHLSEHWNGGGYWYPGYTGVNGIDCDMRAGQGTPDSWDNRISSRYRN